MSAKIKAEYNNNAGAGRLRHYDQHASHETVQLLSSVYFEDDFLGQALNTVVNWTAEDTGAATETLIADSPSGYAGLTLTSASEKQEAGLHQNDFRTFILNQGLIFEARIRPSVLCTLLSEMYIGLAGDYVEGDIANNGPAEHIFFVLDGGGAITIHTDDTTNDNSAVSTGVTLTAADWAVLRIDCSVITDVRFYINGAAVATGTTFDMSDTPALALQPYLMCHKESGAGLGVLWIDYVRIWQNRA